MGGKSMKAMRDIMNDNENFNAAEVTSAVSILPGQSGSPRENREGGVHVTDLAPKDLKEENACFKTHESSSNDKQALFQDMLRSKLISDFNSRTCHSNPETEIDKKDMTQIIIERLSVIEQILVQIFLLSDPEKLFLYQKFPNSQNNIADTLSPPLNLLGNQQEIQQAIFWIKTHLGEIYEKSALEQDIYDQYIGYCQNGSMKALSTSDFGKVMKQVCAEIRARRLAIRNFGAPSMEIKEERTENHKKKLKTPSESPKIPSATVVKDSAPEVSKLSDVENLTVENEVATHSATKSNLTNDMNNDSENKDKLSQPLLRLPTTNIDDINCALGKDLDIFSDNVAEVIKNGCTNNKIIVNFLDKVQLNNEELNVNGPDEVDKSNEVNPTQNVKSAESEPNTFLPTRIPLRVVKRIIQIASFKRMSGQRTLRIQGRRSSKRTQRSRGRRPQPQPQRCRRRRYVSIRLEPVNCGTYWLNTESLLRDKTNDIADLTRVIEEKVKYFGLLEDTKVLGIVGETMIKELLKLNLKTIAEIFFSGLEIIRGARNQSCLGNTSGVQSTPADIAVQGGLPQRSQSSDEYSAEPTVTFQKQGDIEYVSNHQLLISNMENMVNLNTVDVNRQSNTFIDTRPDNSSVSSSTNLRFFHISPDSETSLLTPENSMYFSHQTAPNTLNNNVLLPNYCSRPDGRFLPLNHGFLFSNNVLPPNNNLISSGSTFLPENNNDLNGFDNINTGIFGALDARNNIMAEGTFPQPTPDFAPENYSANFYRPNAPQNFYGISNFNKYLPDEANFNQASTGTDSVFPNLPEEIDQLLMNQLLFDDPLASIVTSQLEPVNNMTGREFWFPNNYTCNNTKNILDQYSNEQTNLFDSNEHSFEPISDCQTTGSVMESDPLPMLSLDDLAMDSDDIIDQIFSHNFESDSNNFNFNNNNSLDILSGQIDETLNQTDSLLELQAGDNDFFDDLFDGGAESKDPPGEGSMNECASFDESSALDNFSYGDDINDQLNEYLGLN